MTSTDDERLRLLAAYDDQLRSTVDAPSALAVVRHGPLFLVTYAGGRGFVTYPPLADVDGDGVRQLVVDTLGHYRSDPAIVRVDWKTRGHDDAPGLHETLVGHGFVPGEPEAVMIGSAESLAVDVPLPDGVTLRKVEDEADLLAFCQLQATVFDIEIAPMLQALQRRLAVDPLMELWIADAGGEVVSGGRLEPVAGTEFAGIWGGATLPECRGRGIYRALTAARARSALSRGMTLINSDSTEYSRPILERYGFLKVTTTTPYRLDLTAESAQVRAQTGPAGTDRRGA
ncbi:GNAT family N-acetyltransferase [Nocardioides sp.]|uniref:GNAT family N-acetyltransferase n=1 Tax=Nocardioides sp. TaxID=35761 RepID=UPI002ED0E1AD